MGYEKTVSDSSSSNSSSSTSWSGGMSVGWGMWSFGGGASGGSTAIYRASEQSSVQVRFKYMRTRIIRPWLDTNLFRQRFWTWKNTHGYDQISDGGDLTATPPKRPVGRMPFIPMWAIVAKDVELISEFSEADYRYTESHWETKASFGWGPFKVGGNYSRRDVSEYASGHNELGRIVIEHPQVIGFTGMLVPECPNPDRSLGWGGDAVFSENESDESRKARRYARHMDFASQKADEKVWELEREYSRRLSLEIGNARQTSFGVAASEISENDDFAF